MRTIAEVFRERCELQSLQILERSHSGWGRHENTCAIHHRQSKVIATLKASYAHAKAAIRSIPDADLEKPLELERREDNGTWRLRDLRE